MVLANLFSPGIDSEGPTHSGFAYTAESHKAASLGSTALRV